MKKSLSYNKLIYIIPIVYILAVSAYMIWHRAWLSPDQFFAFAILATIFIGRTKQFLRDWIPVLLLLFGYEYLRGIVPYLTKYVNIWPMIRADELLFGFLPTIKLQEILFNGVTIHWYDYVAVTLYISHFIIPMVIAFVFWMYDRKIFKEFTAAFLVLSYMAFFTFIIFPAMPPWMASNQGYIPPLKKIMDQVMVSFAHPIDVPSVYRFFGANLVAAVPSLHAAYPWLIFIYLMKKFRGLSVLALPYVAGVWFAVVYLGEHYVVDVILGFVYASIAYLIISFFDKRRAASLASNALLE
jgi:PAP2 superfamily